MSLVVKDLIDAGVHYGHRASRWNPKMKPYIYGKRNLIHIIDLKETVRGLLRAIKFFQRVAASNGLILFVGTKRQAADTIIEQCNRSGMPFVTERWLGGTLTNFRTIRSRLQRLEELESTLDGEQALSYSKKMISTLSRERRKIERNLRGNGSCFKATKLLVKLCYLQHMRREATQPANNMSVAFQMSPSTNGAY